MRIDRVALKGFLSHTATDWNPNGARLVTLVGANGAGKSSLLDAVAFALFDAARGRTDDLVQLGATEMAVTVEFAFAGARYRVTRGRTTRAGGKSYLELHVADGEGWRPLTGDSIRETQAAIEDLLRVDAATFETAVLLGQGKAHAFAEATAAERKRILSTILGLDVYARAEAVAREEARDLEAKASVQRSRIEQLDAQLAERDAVQAAIEAASAEVTAAEAGMLAIDRRIRVLTEQVAAGAVAQADVERLAASLDALAQRHRATKDRRDGAQRAALAAGAALAGEAAVTAATEALPALRAAVAAWEQRQVRRDEIEAQVRAKSLEAQQAGAQHDQEDARWQSTYEALRTRVDELSAGVAGLTPVTCPHCRKPFEIDQAGLREKLQIARVQFGAHEKARPEQPVGLARLRAAVAALEGRLRENGYDAEAHRTAGQGLRAVEATAARAEALLAHRAAKARAELDAEQAARELDTILGEGRQAKADHEAAKARVAELEPQRTALADASRERPRLAERHAAAIAAVSRARVQIEQLDALAAERAGLASALEAADVEIVRLRRLAAAFSVTGIPARIIESVLPELAGYANELLGQLRPGVTLELRAQRAKKDGKGVVEALDLVVRDAAGERPLAMFSGGERMSVSLSLAVGLSRLVARRAGTALRTLVIDEPDGLDAEARRAFGQALRVLAHQGELERVVVVSHHEDLAEVGDAIYRVTKGGHGSVVEQVA